MVKKIVSCVCALALFVVPNLECFASEAVRLEVVEKETDI